MSSSLNHSADILLRILSAHRSFARQFFQPAVRRSVAQSRGRTPIVFYSQVAWDTVWQRPQEQALGLSRYRPVIYISPVQIHEVVTRLKDRYEPVRHMEGGRLTVLSPIIFSGEYRSLGIRKLNRRIVARVLSSCLGNRQPIFLTNSPFSSWLIPRIRPAATAYDLIDDFCSFDWAPPEGRQMEDVLLEEASLAFAGTGWLQQMYTDRIDGLLFLPSGVKFDLMTKPIPEPADLKDLPHPRILYVGTLNDRLDGSLFSKLAKRFDRGSIVVVGPRHASFSAPELPSNVHFMGLKEHSQLPGYYQHCDLGVMPFADSPAAQAINPVKTLEYLACGLPVLSTPVPDVIRYYPDVVRVEKPAEWANAAAELLDGDCEDSRATRVAFAKDRGWDRLIVDMERQFRRLEATF